MPAKVNTSGVYKIVNAVNGRTYVGSSVGIENRWLQHKYRLNRGNHHSPYLQYSWNKYGSDIFEIMILEECEPIKEVLLEREQHYIDTLNPEYNICPKAGSRLGSRASEETKKKMSQSMVGKNVGKVRSDETRALLSGIATNISDETRAKMSAAKLGTRVSEDTKTRMSKAKIGKAKTAEHVAAFKASFSKNRNDRLRETAIADKVHFVRSKRSLTEDQVRTIRASNETDTALAPMYNLSAASIRKVRNRTMYKDVE